jgi:hypothetical protein
MIAFVAGCAIAIAATSGCVPSQKHIKALESGSQAVGAMVPIVAAAYEALQQLCLEEPAPADAECIRAVRARFGPVESSVELFRRDYCETTEHPETCR